MSFGIALSGINAAQSDLDVTANNVANSQTTGFKQSRSEFAELFAVSPQGVSRTQTGHGVKLAAVSQQFTQGNIEATNNSLDLAISGQGFFVLSDAGAAAYTRAGAFQTDNDGYVVNTEGQRLQVYPADGRPAPSTRRRCPTCGCVTSDSAPAATANAEIDLQPAGQRRAAGDGDLRSDGHQQLQQLHLSLTVYDSLGAAHTASMYFVKTAAANAWDSASLRRRQWPSAARRRWTIRPPAHWPRRPAAR